MLPLALQHASLSQSSMAPGSLKLRWDDAITRPDDLALSQCPYKRIIFSRKPVHKGCFTVSISGEVVRA